MAVKSYPYDVSGDYTYNSSKIEVSGGLASLKEDLTNVYARWHLNEATGATVLDSSGNGRHAVQGTGTQQASVSGGGLDFSSADPEDFYQIIPDQSIRVMS